MHIHIRVQRIVFGQIANFLSHLYRLLHHIMPTNLYGALSRRNETGSNLHGSRLASSIGAKEAKNLPLDSPK